ncbi:MarR family transcriptional regulator [Virgibacillus sp. 179-BFC.A HS]|uniref:MarR family transcriptional regulator n=1 Tax=Tigheibacillus jepli TaxID=3035914 RepID=A0ABU5CL10_9BACI|nr:MarR family transcriptional regulator [Virgibacillus sp. 179-BFC.A HS]MDY0407046.1 MarR family transcriptional regulator [Virgibacillus sp. 179-BFC.A HS]
MKDDDLIELEKTIRKMMNIGTKEWKRHIKLKFTRTEALVLYKLNNEGPQRASQLAKSLYITTGGLTGITDKLVKRLHHAKKR